MQQLERQLLGDDEFLEESGMERYCEEGLQDVVCLGRGWHHRGETELLLHSKRVHEGQRKSMNRYHAIGVEVLMDYPRMGDHYLLAYMMERIRLDELAFSTKNNRNDREEWWYHFDECPINRGLAVAILPMDPTGRVGSLVLAHHDEQAHLMRVHQHHVDDANRPVEEKLA